ncbi:MAG: putative peptide zinc metalloprotease protein [Actinomycetota bacterium]|nr:putative peptide zinc metalloprotease protein [Actinomycetota bacterium]
MPQGRSRSNEEIDVFALAGSRAAMQTEVGVPVAAMAGADETVAHPDLWEDLAERVDPSLFRPKLASDIEIRIFRLRWGNDYALAANPRWMLHLNLEVWEAELAQRLDGTRTVSELIVERLNEDGDFDADAVVDLVQILAASGSLEPQELDVPNLVTQALKGRGPMQTMQRFVKTFSIEWTGADSFVRRIYRAGLRWLFHPIIAFAMTLIALAGLVAFVMVERSGDFSLGLRAAPLESIILILLGWILTFSHELGHAAVLIHYDRRIKNAGFMLYFGSPAFFVDATDGLMLDRGPRLMQSFAGPFAELVLAGASSLLVFFLPAGGLANLFFRFSLLNYFVIFLNLVPLLELDGYWILSDLIQVPDLRPRSLQFTQHELPHKIRARERLTPQEIGLTLYGLAGIAFTIFAVWLSVFFWRETFGNLFTSLWHGGTGSRILLALLILVLAGPVVRGVAKLIGAIYRRARSVGRKIRFRLETGWRVEAAELIDALPAFQDLPGEILSDLAGRVVLRELRPGQVVTRQGDRATAFYVIRRGTFQVETEHPETDDVQSLGTLGRGDSFGEIGLLHNAPRQATVRAQDEGEVFEIDKGTFDRLLADPINAPTFGPTLQALAELRDLPVFGHLGTDRLAELLDHGAWLSFSAGDHLMVQGARGDAFFAVASGQADVLVDGKSVSTVTRGGFAGELALLRDAPRSATVIARTPMRAFRLSREGFDSLIAEAFTHGTLRSARPSTWEH